MKTNYFYLPSNTDKLLEKALLYLKLYVPLTSKLIKF